jgi:hypothetical protein
VAVVGICHGVGNDGYAQKTIFDAIEKAKNHMNFNNSASSSNNHTSTLASR